MYVEVVTMNEPMSRTKYLYWKRKRNGLCVVCSKPTDGTTRCPVCAKKVSVASAKSQKKRLDTLRARIAELEGNA
jgi:hypothetical protein